MRQSNRNTEAIVKYIGAIRNPQKKLYAQRYYLHLMYGGEEPADTCTVMACQAVRMNLSALYNVSQTEAIQ